MNWRYLLFFILGAILVVVVSCQPEIKDDDEESLPYHFVNFIRHSASCAADSMQCAAMRVEYPHYDSSSAEIRDRINQSIQEELRKALASQAEQDENSLTEIAQQFFNDYEEFALADFAMPWTLETFSDILMTNDSFFILVLDTYVFTGGAHPNSHRIILNYDLQKGALLSLKDIVLDFEQFSAVAEDIFRQEKGIDPAISLQKAGYLVDDFKVSSQFALTKTGLLLFYNTYEIAPYAAGVTEFEIPYPLLKELIYPEYLPN